MARHLLTAREAAEYLGCSKSYFEAHIRPLLPVVDMGRPEATQPMPRWHQADLDAFIASRKKAS